MTAAAWLLPCLSVISTDMYLAVRVVLAVAVVPTVAMEMPVACTLTELGVHNSDLLSRVGMMGVGPVCIADLVARFAVNIFLAVLICIPHRLHIVYL